jgi:oligoendopeptidase F
MGFRRISSFQTWAVATVLIAGAVALGVAQERERSQIPEQFKWNLADIYPDDASWRTAKNALAAQVAELAQFQGKLGSSAAGLADALDRFYALDKTISRLFVYTSMLADQDTRDSPHQGMKQEMTEAAAAFSAQASTSSWRPSLH